jgi:cell division cycle 2-like protein
MSLAACRGHPSVVKLVATHADTGRRDGDCFLVTRYAGPLNLHQYMALRLQQERPFTEADVRDAMRQLLSGTKRAHKAGVLHRDMAPGNVVVDRTKWGRMVYRICGFGMSERAASREAGKEKEGDGGAALASTSPYRAPELFLGSELYDDRVDTWGLGCIMAELIAGAGEPFFGKLQDEVFDKVQEVAGRRGMVLWEGMERVAGRDRAAGLRERYAANVGRMREVFPEGVISKRGFEVLAGLLDTNPESRLTAKQALEKPWFRRNGFAGRCFAP